MAATVKVGDELIHVADDLKVTGESRRNAHALEKIVRRLPFRGYDPNPPWTAAREIASHYIPFWLE